MSTFPHKLAAFIKRDFITETSYRLSFVLIWFGIFVSVFTFYFIAKLFGQGAIPYLKDYGGDYFSFVLIGIAFSNCLASVLSNFSVSLRHEQMLGTLEAILMTPTKISTIMISTSIWNFIVSSLTLILYFLFGFLFFGFHFINVNFSIVFITLFLTVISFSSVGIISAAFIMIFKKGDPIAWVIATFSALFGGVYFPITVLPKKLQIISHFLPMTYSLRIIRFSLLQNYPLKLLAADMMTLLFFTIILLPLSIFIFRYSIRRAKIDGSLVHY